jgi:hypothetical protein
MEQKLRVKFGTFSGKSRNLLYQATNLSLQKKALFVTSFAVFFGKSHITRDKFVILFQKGRFTFHFLLLSFIFSSLFDEIWKGSLSFLPNHRKW